jgi:tripartite-type tricarboxylate transporter receptor subunit TctC
MNGRRHFVGGLVLIVSASSSLRTVEDFVRKSCGHRGDAKYASTGVGTISHLVVESLKLAADIDVVHGPYRGAGRADHGGSGRPAAEVVVWPVSWRL